MSKPVQYFIDCSVANAEDRIIEMDGEDGFVAFLKSSIKVNGKKNNLGDTVSVTSDGDRITVTVSGPFSKRYLKYLSKKFLKREQLRDFLRVVSKNPATYELRFFNIYDPKDDEAEEDDE